MKFKNFFIAFSVLTISLPALAMKRGFLLSKAEKERKEKENLITTGEEGRKTILIPASLEDWQKLEEIVKKLDRPPLQMSDVGIKLSENSSISTIGQSLSSEELRILGYILDKKEK